MERGRYSKVSVYLSLMLHQKREKSEEEYWSDGQAIIGKQQNSCCTVAHELKFFLH